MYIEYYIIENLLINYIIISTTTMLTKTINTKKRMFTGALIGTIYSILYLYPSFIIMFSLPLKILIIILITLISFRYKNKKEYIKILTVFYLVNIFLSGSTYFIIYFTGISHIRISFIIVCVYVSCKLLIYTYKDIKTLQYLKEINKSIEITLCGRQIKCSALIDSGNLLKDPTTNNEVILVKPDIFNNMFKDEIIEIDYSKINSENIYDEIEKFDSNMKLKVRLIPYRHAKSEDTQIIIGFKCDYVEIDNKKITNIVIAISDFDNQDYDAILSPVILADI